MTDKTQEIPSPAREGKEGKEQPETPALCVPSPNRPTPWAPSPGRPGWGLGARPAPCTPGAGTAWDREVGLRSPISPGGDTAHGCPSWVSRGGSADFPSDSRSSPDSDRNASTGAFSGDWQRHMTSVTEAGERPQGYTTPPRDRPGLRDPCGDIER